MFSRRTEYLRKEKQVRLLIFLIFFETIHTFPSNHSHTYTKKENVLSRIAETETRNGNNDHVERKAFECNACAPLLIGEISPLLSRQVPRFKSGLTSLEAQLSWNSRNARPCRSLPRRRHREHRNKVSLWRAGAPGSGEGCGDLSGLTRSCIRMPGSFSSDCHERG